jgi:sugar/nucleoside kinase (ribokinase family)
MMATMLIDDLVANGINVDHLKQVDRPTGVTIAIFGAERTFLSFRGANALPYGPIPDHLIKLGDCLHLSGYSFQNEESRNTALALISQAKRRDGHISLDPSFHFAREFGEQKTQSSALLADLDFIFPNLEEARLLSGTDDPIEAATRIRADGPKAVIVTLGDQGCYVDSDHRKVLVPTFPVHQVVDATGAGDAFCGGFLAGMLWGLDMTQAAQLGHIAAGRVIGQVGGHKDTPSLNEAIIFASGHDEELTEILRDAQRKQKSIDR